MASRIGPLDEGVVEGADAEFGGEARGQVRYAALLEGFRHGFGEADVLERRAFPQLAVGGDDGEQAGGELAAVVGEGGGEGAEGRGNGLERRAGPGAAAIASARIRLCMSWPANSTSRLSGKCRKKVILVSPPARSAISLTVVAS